jgi:hypothetical protein
MARIQNSTPARIRDRFGYDVHVRERVELDVPAESLEVPGVRFECDHRPCRPNEASPEKREEAHVRADVEEDRRWPDKPFKDVLHRRFGLS